MFSLIFKIIKVLGSLLALLGALQLMKFTLYDQLAAFGLHIPVWVTGATVFAFTAVFLVSLTALKVGRNRQVSAGTLPSTLLRHRSRPGRAVGDDGNQNRYRQRLNTLLMKPGGPTGDQ